MTLQQRIELIDMLISENPDANIKDYLELVGDLQTPVELVEPAPIIPIIEKVRKPRKLDKKYLQTYRLRL